jgi:hypothetical protein
MHRCGMESHATNQSLSDGFMTLFGAPIADEDDTRLDLQTATGIGHDWRRVDQQQAKDVELMLHRELRSRGLASQRTDRLHASVMECS